jgi:16S rRNA (guanine(966)-N(2))-methyltransferase RsmD
MPPPRSSPLHAAPHAGFVRIIGGSLKRSRLAVAARAGLRPTPDRVRETLFNWLGQDLGGRRCLDLFAGSGALGIEAASRGAATVDLVERDAALARALEAGCARLGASQVRVHARDALQFAARCAPGSYDLVFIDPPFALADSGLHQRALEAAARLLPAGGQVYLEAPDAAHLRSWCSSPTWVVQRSAHAGQVHYALLQRAGAAAPADDQT